MQSDNPTAWWRSNQPARYERAFTVGSMLPMSAIIPLKRALSDVLRSEGDYAEFQRRLSEELVATQGAHRSLPKRND